MSFKSMLVEKEQSELKIVQKAFGTKTIKEAYTEMGWLYTGKVEKGYIMAGRANGPLEADIYDKEDGNKIMSVFIKD